MRTRALSDEPENDGEEREAATPAGDGPEYEFEGYNVESSRKIRLTPVTPARERGA
jgi:hypothetical protein